MTRALTLYGSKISMYTGKTRSHLIKQGIEFTEVVPVTDHYSQNVQPDLKRRIIPVIETHDGHIVQDTSDIIDFLEGEGIAKKSVYPKDPLSRLISLIFELFGDEGLQRPAMHYRWNFPDQQSEFLKYGFGGFLSPDAAPSEWEMIEKVMAKFNGLLGPLGINEDTIPEIERSYKELLAALEYHFARVPYLLGDQPTVGDYGMVAPLYAHLGRDPVPSAEMKNEAPNLYRWTERMNQSHDDLSDMPYAQLHEGLPDTLLPILSYIGKYFLPEMLEQVEKTEAVLQERGDPEIGEPCLLDPTVGVIGFGSFQHGEIEMPTIIRPIRLYKLQRVTDCFDQMAKEEQAKALSYLETVGLKPLVTLKAARRVERKDHQEVWG